MAASVTGLMMPASTMAVFPSLCATGYPAGVVRVAAHVRAAGDATGIVCMAAHVCATGYPAGVVRMAAHVRATGDAAGVVSVAAHVRATGDAAGVVSVAAHVRTAWDTAGIVRMAAHVCAPRQTAGMVPMSVVSGVRITVLAVMYVDFCLGTSCSTASAVGVLPGQRTAIDAAGPVYMRGFQAASLQPAGMVPMPIVSGMRITIFAVVHVGLCIGTSSNVASAVGMLPDQRTAVDAAGPMHMRSFQTAPRQSAGMIPVTIVSGVGITILAVVHMEIVSRWAAVKAR